MLVEFCAPPGSGKTTVSKAWCRATLASGVKVQRAKHLPFFARKKLVIQAHLRKRRVFPENSLEHFCKLHCHADREGFSGKLIKDLVQYAYWQDRSVKSVVLFDESVSQQFLLFSMRSEADLEALVEPYLQRMPRMDVIATLTVPPEVSFARIWQREPEGPYFFGDKSREETLRLLRRANRACDLLLKGAERMGIKVIRCNGEARPEENVRRLSEAINRTEFGRELVA